MKMSRSGLFGVVAAVALGLLPGAALAETYDVTVKTGDANWAGTNANVWMNLYGVRRFSGETFDAGNFQLSDKGSNKFEKGSKRTFRVTTPSDCKLGDIYGLRIEQDHTGAEPDWYLVSIELKDVSSGKTKTFLCNGWLSEKTGWSRYLKPFENF